MAKSVHEFEVKKINGQKTTLGEYKGRVLLVVNVASKCGLTPQYEGLERLHKKYAEKGLTIAGFPANEFLAQEPGTNEEIAEFCQLNYGVSFPLFSKIVVKGEGQHPLYRYLTETRPEALKNPGSQMEEKLAKGGLGRTDKKDILWNFEKFLVGRKGEVIARFNPDVKPEDPILVDAIEKALTERA